MFTSRAEFRLQLREDNADMRLTEIGRKLGLVDDARWEAFNRKSELVSRETARLAATWLRPATVSNGDATRLFGKPLEHEYSGIELLRRPDVSYDDVAEAIALAGHGNAVSRGTLTADVGSKLANEVIDQLQVAVKYAGYIDKQREDVARSAGLEHMTLPTTLDFNEVRALSFEVRQTLTKHRPLTLGAASRLSGVTPAAVSLLLIHLKRARIAGFGDTRGSEPAASSQPDPAPGVFAHE